MSMQQEIYVYGKLNRDLILRDYTGKETDTANTIVDNKNNEISVNVKIDNIQVTLEASNWSNNEITVTASGVTDTNNVIVCPDTASQEAYTSTGILCTAQSINSLTFTCDTIPSIDITVNILILG